MDWVSDAGGVPAAARRRELSGPLRARPGLWGHGPGRFLPWRPVGYRRGRWRWGPPVCRRCCSLVPAPLLRCADHFRGAVVRQRGKLRVRVGAGWWSVWWRAPECLRERLGSGEIFVGLADTDVVAPEGAARPSWRASGLPFLSPRRVPGETLGSSVVIVASLLGGVDWYRRFGV